MNAKGPRLFRDPVHDIITLDRGDPVDDTLFRLINTPEFQRLRRIRQLGMSFLVYHGAEHSRFTHSMGVMHLARLMHDRLFPSTGGDRIALSAAALLHDIGHGPFSHVIERVSGVHHESITLAVIQREGTAIHRILTEADPTLPDRIVAILQGTHPLPALTDIVSSQLDADRLDYILRDRLATGVRIGDYDLGRILQMLRLEDGHMVVHQRAQEAIEGYLLARFHMYTQVYLHKASRSAEQMLSAAIDRVRWLRTTGFRFQYFPADLPLARLLHGDGLEVEEHCALDDTDLWHAFKHWAREADPVLAEISEGLVHRRLYKTIAINADDPRGEAGVIADARDAVEKAGGDPRCHLLIDRSADTGYRPYQPGLKTQPIRILDDAGRVRPIEQSSAIVESLGGHLHERTRLCVPARLAEQVQRVAGPTSAPRLV